MSDNTVQYVDFDRPEQCTNSLPVSGRITIRKNIFWAALLQRIIVVLARINPDRYKNIARKLLRGGFNGEQTPILYRSSDEINRFKELPNNYFIDVNLKSDRIAFLIKNFVDSICGKSVRVKIAVRYSDNDSLYPINLNQSEDCLKSKPARCTIDFAFNGRWNQLFLLILEILKTFFPEQYNLLTEEGFTENSKPLLYKRKPSWMLSAKQLSDGLWVESHGSTPALITRIKSFLDFLSEGTARLKIQYVPRKTDTRTVKPTSRSKVQSKQTQDVTKPQPEVVKPVQSVNEPQRVDFPVQSVNEPQRVDFFHTERCKGTRPVECVIQNRSINVGNTWRDLLVNILDVLREINPSKYNELKYHGFRAGTKPRLSHQPSLMQGKPKKLYDGYYVEVHKIPELVKMIKQFVDYIGEGSLPIEIQYVSKENSQFQMNGYNSRDIENQESDDYVSEEYDENDNSSIKDVDQSEKQDSFEQEELDDHSGSNFYNKENSNKNDSNLFDYEDSDSSDLEDDEDDSDIESFDENYDEMDNDIYNQLSKVIQNEPAWNKGIEFNPNVIRILSERCSTELDEDVINHFRNRFCFRRGNKYSKVFVLLESVASQEVQQEIVNQAYTWLKEYGLFQLECLYSRFKDTLDQVGVIQDLDDFENYLVTAYTQSRFSSIFSIKPFGWPYYSTRFVRDSNRYWEGSFEKLGKRITQIIQDMDEQMILLEELCRQIPCIDSSLMDNFIGRYTELISGEINGSLYYQTKDAHYNSYDFPDNFSEMLSNILTQISDYELPASCQTIVAMLTSSIGGNFLKRYGIPENDDYEELGNIIERYYNGIPKREWQDGEFVVIPSQEEENRSEDEQINLFETESSYISDFHEETDNLPDDGKNASHYGETSYEEFE